MTLPIQPHAYDITASGLRALDPRGFAAFLYLRRLPAPHRPYFLASLLRSGVPYTSVRAYAALCGGITLH